MATVFKHHLWTGSGRVTAHLTFLDDGSAEIEYDLNWMGVGRKWFKVQCRHEQFSKAYGVLHLDTIEPQLDKPNLIRVDELDKLRFGDDPDLPEEMRAVYREITYEYLRLPASEPYIPDDPGYEDMRNFGYAKWETKFDLILILHFCAFLHGDYGGDLKNQVLQALLLRLDKMKFELLPKDPSN